jgi:pyruvate/2-oxoglutarate dehydrogenase complex dihydrolipoamide dehydrogenase (E3) component
LCYNAAELLEDMKVARSYSINNPDVKINWKEFKMKRDKEIKRLNEAYNNLLVNSGVK